MNTFADLHWLLPQLSSGVAAHAEPVGFGTSVAMVDMWPPMGGSLLMSGEVIDHMVKDKTNGMAYERYDWL